MKDFIMTGDVQAVESQLPVNAKKITKQPVAYGEKSGHIHVITGDYEMYEDDNFKYVAVGKKGALSQHVHQNNFDTKKGFEMLAEIEKADHKPSRLLPNKVYKIGIHKSYNPYRKIFEKVID